MMRITLFNENLLSSADTNGVRVRRRDHVQEHHAEQQGAHEGGHLQRDAQARTRGLTRRLHPRPDAPGQRSASTWNYTYIDLIV